MGEGERKVGREGSGRDGFSGLWKNREGREGGRRNWKISVGLTWRMDHCRVSDRSPCHASGLFQRTPQLV